jgi:hypothetical protein
MAGEASHVSGDLAREYRDCSLEDAEAAGEHSGFLCAESCGGAQHRVEAGRIEAQEQASPHVENRHPIGRHP